MTSSFVIPDRVALYQSILKLFLLYQSLQLLRTINTTIIVVSVGGNVMILVNGEFTFPPSEQMPTF